MSDIKQYLLQPTSLPMAYKNYNQVKIYNRPMTCLHFEEKKEKNTTKKSEKKEFISLDERYRKRERGKCKQLVWMSKILKLSCTFGANLLSAEFRERKKDNNNNREVWAEWKSTAIKWNWKSIYVLYLFVKNKVETKTHQRDRVQRPLYKYVNASWVPEK